MKKMILAVLFASLSLIAADNLPTKKLSGWVPIDGAKMYKQHCAVCHGEKGEKTQLGLGPIAGMDTVILALEIREYRDQEHRTEAYAMRKYSQIMKEAAQNMSRDHIVAIAKYVNSLK